MLSLFTLICVILPISGQHFISWTEEHQQCVLHLPSSHHRTSHLYAKGNGAWSIDSKDIHCADMPYIDYFRTISKSPPSEYHHQMATAIISLYKDLAEARKPTLLTAEHIQKNLPNYYRTFAANASQLSILVHPISFAIPEENIVGNIPAKLKGFGQVIPAVTSTYFHLTNESLYFSDMSKSLFCITYKKAGWDCLRHYEILAAGSLPLFVNIKHCPHQALTAHPKKIYRLLLKVPGLHVSAKKVSAGSQAYHFEKLAIDYKVFDYRLYNAVLAALLPYTRHVLSTKGMAEFMLATMFEYSQPQAAAQLQAAQQGSLSSQPSQLGSQPGQIGSIARKLDSLADQKANHVADLDHVAANQHAAHQLPTTSYHRRLLQATSNAATGNKQHPRKILYLTHKDKDMDKGDYLTDFLLHGLLQLLGPSAVYDFPSRDCLYKIFPHFNHTIYYQARSKLYGQGFSYGLKVDVLADTIERNMEEVKQAIIHHEYDLIILGSGHRDGWASKLFFWELVCQYYHRNEVGFLDGGDEHLGKKVLDRYAICAGHIFSREGYAPLITKTKD